MNKSNKKRRSNRDFILYSSPLSNTRNSKGYESDSSPDLVHKTKGRLTKMFGKLFKTKRQAESCRLSSTSSYDSVYCSVLPNVDAIVIMSPILLLGLLIDFNISSGPLDRTEIEKISFGTENALEFSPKDLLNEVGIYSYDYSPRVIELDLNLFLKLVFKKSIEAIKTPYFQLDVSLCFGLLKVLCILIGHFAKLNLIDFSYSILLKMILKSHTMCDIDIQIQETITLLQQPTYTKLVTNTQCSKSYIKHYYNANSNSPDYISVSNQLEIYPHIKCAFCSQNITSASKPGNFNAYVIKSPLLSSSLRSQNFQIETMEDSHYITFSIIELMRYFGVLSSISPAIMCNITNDIYALFLCPVPHELVKETTKCISILEKCQNLITSFRESPNNTSLSLLISLGINKYVNLKEHASESTENSAEISHDKQTLICSYLKYLIRHTDSTNVFIPRSLLDAAKGNHNDGTLFENESDKNNKIIFLLKVLSICKWRYLIFSKLHNLCRTAAIESGIQFTEFARVVSIKNYNEDTIQDILNWNSLWSSFLSLDVDTVNSVTITSKCHRYAVLSKLITSSRKQPIN